VHSQKKKEESWLRLVFFHEKMPLVGDKRKAIYWKFPFSQLKGAIFSSFVLLFFSIG